MSALKVKRIAAAAPTTTLLADSMQVNIH